MDQNQNPTPNGGEPESRLPAQHIAASNQALAVSQQKPLALLLSGREGGEDEGNLDLMAYWRAIIKRKWLVLALLLVAGAWSTVDTLLTPKIYMAAATIEISSGEDQIVNVGDVDGNRVWGGNYFETQQQMIKSRALAQRVVSELALLESGEFDRIQPLSSWEQVLEFFGASREAVERPDAPEPDRAKRERMVANWFASSVSVTRVANSDLASISFQSPDPAFSVRAVNALIESYLSNNLERRFDSSAYAKTYLEDRLAELKVKLEDSERQLVEFANQEQIVAVGSDLTAGTMTEQDMLNANAALTAARGERLKAETRWRQAQASTGTVVAGMIGENTMVQTLQERRAELQAEYQNRLARFKPAYPAMQELEGQIKELDRQISSEIESVKVAIRAEYEAALAQEETLANLLTELKADVLDLQSRSIRYNILKREVATNRELYDGLLQRYKEIGVAAGVSANNLAIVDRAESAYQVSPNMRRNVSLGLAMGLCFGILLALLLEFLDDTIKSPIDVESKLRLVHLGVVPKLDKDETPGKASKDLRSGFSEAYRSIRTALQFSTDRGIPTTLVVTSTTPGEGKSTTAVALARNFAQLGKRVLLIDADLRNPSVHKLFSLENNAGLSNCLAGAVKPGECIRFVESESMSVMTSGPLPPNPAELLAGPKMVSLIAQASERFDHVVIDSAPVVGLADALILTNLASGTVLVIEAGRARVGAVQASIKRLRGARAHLLGAVLTKFSERHAGYGYGYGYGYGTPQQSLATRIRGSTAIKRLSRGN
jgi:capsular exopolysaccharide synthesis family protein